MSVAPLRLVVRHPASLRFGLRAVFLRAAAALPLLLLGPAPAVAQTTAPGGFLEKATSGEIRPRLSAAQIAGFLPVRGSFTFPGPYLTQGARLTNGTDCGGSDCVLPVGYSYWRNINNHAGSNELLVFLGLDAQRGGTGPTLFRYDKVTGSVTKSGPLFPAGSPFRGRTGEGWYFSGSRPTALYLDDGSRLLRYDVIAGQFETVFDAAPQFGTDTFIWQAHSSDDDRVHSATLRRRTTSEMLGCLAYREDLGQLLYYPRQGVFDECHIDKSGRWLVILQNEDGLFGLENRIIDLQTGTQVLLLDQNGALGHADLGYGYMVGEDDWAALPGAARVWKFGQSLVPGPTQGLIAYHTTDWSVDLGHVTHGNARAGVSPEGQYACNSNASRLNLPRANEVVCYRLDSSLDVLVVAPAMTNLDAAGGGDDYSKKPKGNLDVTGGYFIWTSNMAGGRLDAFLVRVPSYRLVGGITDTTPPVVSIASPAAGAIVSGTVSVSASATDDVGVMGVQFRLDGGALGPEDLQPPYSTSWNTATALLGLHTLTAVARDAAGHSTTSAAVTVSVGPDIAAPAISQVSVSGLSAAGATISWVTNESSDSQAQYGLSAAYGSSTARDPLMVTAHSRTLSGLAPATLYHYRVLSRDGAGNLATSGDATFTTAAGGTAIEPVTWVEVVNCSLSGGVLSKAGGYDGVDDAGAVSLQEIPSGDGYLEFTAPQTGPLLLIGLSHGSTGTGYAEIDFAIRLQSGIADVRENGVWRADALFAAGDLFRVAVESGVVKYYHNGSLMYASTTVPAYPLAADVSILDFGGAIANAMIAGASGGVPGPGEVTNLRWTNGSMLSWNAVPSAVEYHVYRSRLVDLTSSSVGSCRDDLDTNRGDTQLQDAGNPPLGDGFSYLITAETATGAEGSLGFATAGPRINAAPCP